MVETLHRETTGIHDQKIGTREAVIVAVSSQKGGTAKTTTTIHLSAAIAEMGHPVLMVDLDPQGHLAEGFGIV